MCFQYTLIRDYVKLFKIYKIYEGYTHMKYSNIIH